LYNGEAPFPEEKIYRLSDGFKEIDEKTGNNDLISLDLVLRVININKGYNPKLFRKSKTLKGYTTLVTKVNEYAKTKPLEEAIKLAVEYCLKRGMLTNYLKENAQEVIKMLAYEYNVKDAIKFARQEGRQEGKAEGREEGIEKGQNYILELVAQGLSYEEIKKKIEKTSKKNTRGKK